VIQALKNKNKKKKKKKKKKNHAARIPVLTVSGTTTAKQSGQAGVYDNASFGLLFCAGV